MEELTSFIDPAFSLLSALVGALIGGYMTRKATIEGARQAHRLQIQAARADEENLVNKFLWSIHDELAFLHEHYMSSIGNEIERVDKIISFHSFKKWNFENCLLLYNSSPSLIIRIDNIRVRSKTIETHINIKSLFDALQEHFRLSKEAFDISLQPFSLEKNAFENKLHDIIDAHADRIIMRQKEAFSNIESLLKLIEDTIPKQ